MRRSTRSLLAVTAAGALAGVGAVTAPGHAEPSALGALLGCPKVCVGSGPVTGGGIMPSGSGVYVYGLATIVATVQSDLGQPFTEVTTAPISAVVPNTTMAEARGVTLRDATIAFGLQYTTGTVAFTQGTIVIQTTASPTKAMNATLAGTGTAGLVGLATVAFTA